MAYRLTRRSEIELPQTAANPSIQEAGREKRAPLNSKGMQEWQKTVAAVGVVTAAQVPQTAANCRSERGFAAVVYTPLKGGYNHECRTPCPGRRTAAASA